MADIFKFKLFDVDQSNCAMKVNTDGVLLGALATATDPKQILDIGTGTGAIALMLAQRFSGAVIDAVEIDEAAAKTAELNFRNSMFAERMNLYATSFESFFERYPAKRYHLIVSNPPFFLNSLTSPKSKTNVAKHTDEAFFERLIEAATIHLTGKGTFQLIIPGLISGFTNSLALKNGLYLQAVTQIKSFANAVTHREIIVFGRLQKPVSRDTLFLYEKPKIYSLPYKNALTNFLTIF